VDELRYRLWRLLEAALTHDDFDSDERKDIIRLFKELECVAPGLVASRRDCAGSFAKMVFPSITFRYFSVPALQLAKGQHFAVFMMPDN
jgi:hypothetical protein